MSELAERIRSRLAEEGREPTPAAVAAAFRAESGGVASDQDVLVALRSLREELVGAGPLEPLLRDPDTTDVLVFGGGTVMVDRGAGLERSPVRLDGEAAVRRLAQRLAQAAGRRLDDASPSVDGFLAGALDGSRGIRVHAVLAPVAPDGTCLSLRVLRPAAHDLAALRRSGTLAGPTGDVVQAIVAARLAVLVSGGTGSGKTTLLAALLGEVDPAERILTVEDAQELQPRHPQVVRLVARPPNIEGAGGVSLRDLVRQALRMRPDRLVVGEVRGGEVCDLLSALNTGHDGGAGTVHANSAREVPARMEALAAVGGMDRAALHSQLAAAVQVVLHMHRGPAGRVLAAVGVLERAPSGEVRVAPVWEHRTGWTADRPRLDALLRERGVQPPWAERAVAAGARVARSGGVVERVGHRVEGAHGRGGAGPAGVRPVAFHLRLPTSARSGS
ncbi:TadA family conjugal transfer-associated ATPase [Pseudonocardia sp. WMMC193]|uniref:TadA family conjugal transfer-associated ATPase n=1 Tax=Pseudonocardia sp. WMMC193 TaxID=2911965 RepID=UPI001F3856F5|nr:TadA family conjugal transfer-associated ATPase [Pseudonocardia sp. WMMC193]MCF7551620.1 TadA family conjugal transfer-associated ATPase [Pseudonocardia sp. WMMC193]